MIYAIPTLLASTVAFTAPVHQGGAALRPFTAEVKMPALEMSINGRRSQLLNLAGAAAAIGGATAVSAAEPRSTPWSFSTFLDAVESDLIEKVSFSADGKQVLSIDKDGDRHESLILPEGA